MEITKQPAAIHTAFNPIVFEISDNILSEISINITYNGKATTVKKALFNGVAIINISPIVNKFFKDERTIDDVIITDHNLFVEYSVRIVDSESQFIAINAVSQIGESSSFIPKKGSFLTEFERIKMYDGYESTVGILGYDDKTYVIKDLLIPFVSQRHFLLDMTGASYVAIATQNPLHYLLSNHGDVITNNKGEVITIRDIAVGYEEKRLYIDKMCIPLNPFYVRWINSLGGYDYWMFSVRQSQKTKTKVVSQFSPVVYDQENASSFSKVLSIDSDRTIVVGASNLNLNEFQCIEKMQFSPKIQYLKAGKWIDITIDSTGTDSDTFESLQDLELSFNLPQQQFQF